MAINIDLVADVKDVIKGTDKIGNALEEVADQLTDVGKDGAKIDDKVSDAFRNMGKEAKAAGDEIGKSVKDGGDKIGKSVKAGTDEANEGLADLQSEAAGTAAETAASFDGSAESIVGSFQEIAANAFAGFGPAGAAAGLAMAVGIGMAVTALQDGAEKATAMKQKSVDMVDAIAEAGGDLSAMDLSDKIKEWGREVLEDNWITAWADESSTKFQETAKDAKTFGVLASDAIRAAAGSAEDSRQFLDATADDWQKLNDKVKQGQEVSESGLVTFDATSTAAMEQRNALSDLRGQAEENIKTTGDAVEIYGLEADAIGRGKAATEAATEATEAATEALQDKADAMDRASGAAMSADKAELSYVETLKSSAADIKSNGKNIDINTAAGRANRETLLDMADSANSLIEAQIQQGDSTAAVTARTQEARDAFTSAAEKAGFTADAAQALADKYGLIPKNVDTKVQLQNAEEAKRKIDEVTATRTVSVVVSPDGSEVERYFRLNSGRKLYVDIAPRGGVGITD